MRPTVLMLSSQAAELSAFKEILAPWLNIYKLCLIEQDMDEENLQAELLRANFQGLVLPHASEQNEEEYVRRRTQRIRTTVTQLVPSVAIITAGDLQDASLREAFLTHVFLLARFYEVKAIGSARALMSFHSHHKYLYFCYHQRLKDQLGRIVANHQKLSLTEVFQHYEAILIELLQHGMSTKNSTNALQHMFGYLSKELPAKEKAAMIARIDDFRQGKVAKKEVLQALYAEVERTNQAFLRPQVIFEAYPDSLEEVFDSSNVIL